MNKRQLSPLLLCTVLFLASCGGGGGDAQDPGDAQTASPEARDQEDSAQDATCEPQGDTIRVLAENNAFDSECYAAPANREFRVELTNRDTFAHNFSIYKARGKEQYFNGPYVQGAQTQTFDVGPRPAERAYFMCDIHPQMNGVFIFA